MTTLKFDIIYDSDKSAQQLVYRTDIPVLKQHLPLCPDETTLFLPRRQSHRLRARSEPNLTPRGQHLRSLDENLPLQIRQTRPPRAICRRLWLSMSHYQFCENHSRRAFCFRCSSEKIIEDETSNLCSASRNRSHTRVPI